MRRSKEEQLNAYRIAAANVENRPVIIRAPDIAGEAVKTGQRHRNQKLFGGIVMISGEYTILAPGGLHARPAKELSNLVRKFKSRVTLIKDNMRADTDSILGILSMQATYNSKITIEVAGEDEVLAAENLHRFFNEEIMKLQ